MFGLFKTIDNALCAIEGKTPQEIKRAKPEASAYLQGLSGTSGQRLRQFLNGTTEGLDGWKDDKERFKLELLNDIKSFLFGKWEKPWKPSLVFDTNGKLISGYMNIHHRMYKDYGNILRLHTNSGDSPYFITMPQVLAQSGKIQKEHKNKLVYVVSWVPVPDTEKETKEGKHPVKFMAPKSHTVINVDFVDNIKKPAFKKTEFKELELNQYVEAFIKELVKRKRLPKIHYNQADSCHFIYGPGYTNEKIEMVQINAFKKIESYYSVLFHEITHSTHNPARLGRGEKSRKQISRAVEELTAEMGAMIICTELGLEYSRQNSISYLNSWLNGIKGDKDEALLEAHSYACDAAEYLLKDIDIEKLVPASLAKRAKETNSEPAPEQKQSEPKKNTESKSVEPEQLSLFGATAMNSALGSLGFTSAMDTKKAKTYKLRGPLAKFLGAYDRVCYTIALRGDKGAGKSRLLFQLINAFMNKGLTTCFISIEMNKESSVWQNYRDSYLSEKNKKQLTVSQQQFDYEMLSKACQMFDVVAIDSWTKLKGMKQEDFDRLQKENPDTIILAVFQSTTGGVARGGNMVEYDAGTVIHVHEGGHAVCEKNRYAPCDKTYNVFTQKIEPEKEAGNGQNPS